MKSTMPAAARRAQSADESRVFGSRSLRECQIAPLAKTLLKLAPVGSRRREINTAVTRPIAVEKWGVVQRTTTELPRAFASNRRFLLIVSLAISVFLLDSHKPVAAQVLTAEEVARLEPELCNSSPSFFQSVTAVFPFLVGSRSTHMKPEQLALIDQYKPSGRRKVWVLRLPAAFITERTCDAGRSNWTGEGDAIQVSQSYRLAILMLRDRILPVSRATAEELQVGTAVDVYLKNVVRDPAFRHRAFAEGPFVVGRVRLNGPPSCREEMSDIPGLVTFKRIDPDVRRPTDCEGGYRRHVFARKIDDLVYDFIVFCEVNCRVQRDYHGWDVEYSYHYARLPEWQQLHERLAQFLDQYTVYLDTDRGSP